MTTIEVPTDERQGGSGATTRPEQPVVEARGVSKVYESAAGRTRQALRDVSIAVAPGSFTSIMGPSGSGKSTLLHLLGGLVSPTSGSVAVDGQDLDDLDDAALAGIRRHRVGFVFQSFNLVPVLTAAENVGLPGAIAGRSPAMCRERAAGLLGLVGLAAEAGQRPAELSGGEQQRVAIARALFMEPAVLLADEPTGNLDSVTGGEVLEVLRRAHDELGQTTVVVTHDARVAAAGDEVLMLADGELHGRLPLSGGRGRRTAASRERAVMRWLQDQRAGDGAR